MSFLGKIFGKKSAPVTASDPSKDPDMIRVHDSYGREMYVARETWRTSVLLDHIKKVWDQPNELAGIIIQSLHDGFRADIVKAAEHLQQIDPDKVRGTCLWGVVLLEENRLDEAEKVFTNHMARLGEEGVLLTNLAKVYSKRGDEARAEATLWRGLQADPNQDNGMGWYEVIHRERGGETAGLDALRRIAELPGSWRARLWLARAALAGRNLEEALTLYEDALVCVLRPVPPDLLMQMSGDLGNHGHLPELLNLVLPHFQIEIHGLQVGNNLIKALVDLGQLDEARKLLDALYAQNRPDWQPTLSYWDTEIAKVRVAASPISLDQKIQVTLMGLDGPVWLKPTSPAAELFPAEIPSSITNQVRIAFLGSTVGSTGAEIEHQLADTRGRLSRALPLFLCEQTTFSTNALAQTLVPWMSAPSPGFVLSGAAWEDGDASAHARRNKEPNDYVVTSHLKGQDNAWRVEIRIVRTIDGKCLSEYAGSIDLNDASTGLMALSDAMRAALVKEAGVEPRKTPKAYALPKPGYAADYLLRLEQLLAVRCAGMDGVPTGFLSGEREILLGTLQLAVEHPANIAIRILWAQTLLSMKRVRPDIMDEFRERVLLLQKDKPLPSPAHDVVQRLVDEVFTE